MLNENSCRIRTLSLFLYALLFQGTCRTNAHESDWPPENIAGFWLVDSGHYKKSDGSTDRRAGDSFVIILPKRIIMARLSSSGLKKIRSEELNIIGEKFTHELGHVVLCKDPTNRNARLALRSTEGASLEMTMYLKPPTEDFIIIQGQKIPIDRTKYTASVTYFLTRARTQDWGNIIQKQLASSENGFEDDPELLELLTLWVEAKPIAFPAKESEP